MRFVMRNCTEFARGAGDAPRRGPPGERGDRGAARCAGNLTD